MNREFLGEIYVGVLILIILVLVAFGVRGGYQQQKVDTCFEATENYEWCFEKIYNNNSK